MAKFAIDAPCEEYGGVAYIFLQCKILKPASFCKQDFGRVFILRSFVLFCFVLFFFFF